MHPHPTTDLSPCISPARSLHNLPAKDSSPLDRSSSSPPPCATTLGRSQIRQPRPPAALCHFAPLAVELSLYFAVTRPLTLFRFRCARPATSATFGCLSSVSLGSSLLSTASHEARSPSLPAYFPRPLGPRPFAPVVVDVACGCQRFHYTYSSSY